MWDEFRQLLGLFCQWYLVEAGVGVQLGEQFGDCPVDLVCDPLLAKRISLVRRVD